jgi:SecD/SecF fusion protein
MFSKYLGRALLLVAVAAGAVAALPGCQSEDVFGKLDQDKNGFLEPSELDFDRNQLITPDELGVTSTYARSEQAFFADGDSTKDRQLTREEFARALLGDRMHPWLKWPLVLAVIIGPIWLGLQTGKWLRMPEQGWKLAVILFSVVAGAAILIFGWPPKRGIDLSGGVILIYEIDEEATLKQIEAQTADESAAGDKRAARADELIKVDELVTQLRRRINPGGVKDVVIRKYGERQVEIIIPGVEAAETELIKRKVRQTGQLEFLIVANRGDDRHKPMIAKAEENIASRDRLVTLSAQGKEIVQGRWVPVGL